MLSRFVLARSQEECWLLLDPPIGGAVLGDSQSILCS